MISALLLNTFSDRRLADHFGGKLHLGYMQIREKLVDLRVRAYFYFPRFCFQKHGKARVLPGSATNRNI